jgi:hypothetical protein
MLREYCCGIGETISEVEIMKEHITPYIQALARCNTPASRLIQIEAALADFADYVKTLPPAVPVKHPTPAPVASGLTPTWGTACPHCGLGDSILQAVKIPDGRWQVFIGESHIFEAKNEADVVRQSTEWLKKNREERAKYLHPTPSSQAEKVDGGLIGEMASLVHKIVVLVREYGPLDEVIGKFGRVAFDMEHCLARHTPSPAKEEPLHNHPKVERIGLDILVDEKWVGFTGRTIAECESATRAFLNQQTDVKGGR